MRYALLIGLAALTGCVSPAEQARQQAQNDDAMRASDRSRCINYGFVVGTQEYANCIMSIDQQRMADDAAMRRTLVPLLLRR